MTNYIVVTGALRVEGGASTKTVEHVGDRVTREHKKTSDRKAADVIRSDVSRKLHRLGPINTPFGRLYEADKIRELVAIFDEATQAVAEFNATAKGCRLVNGYVWETLTGNRLAAVEGWSAYRNVALA